MNLEQTLGNSIKLLENGDLFFPRLLEAIDHARSEILMETFILRDDSVGRKIQQALIRAAHRGATVALTVDGFGSYYLPPEFCQEMESAGVHYAVYHPQPRWLLFRTNIFRRLHRKLVVIDGTTAFIGGINLTSEHLSSAGANFMVDYAAELQGPAVTSMRRFALRSIDHDTGITIEPRPVEFEPRTALPVGHSGVVFVTRDNENRRTAIELQYLKLIRQARHSVLIANAYFYPGYRVLKALRVAVKRGVEVSVVIPGKSDSPIAQHAEKMLYDFMLKSGINVYEFREHLYHGKIAAFDDDWSTIGSSNLDPISLSLNLEANIFVQDREFTVQIRRAITGLMHRSHVRTLSKSWSRPRSLMNGFMAFLIYHLRRRFPRFTMWLPPAERQASRPATSVPAKSHESGPER